MKLNTCLFCMPPSLAFAGIYAYLCLYVVAKSSPITRPLNIGTMQIVVPFCSLQLATRQNEITRLENQMNSEHARKEVEIASRLDKVKDNEIRQKVGMQ